MADLTDEEFHTVYKIMNRWKDAHYTYCKGCMHQAIRHQDRNMDLACTAKDEEKGRPHPGRWDGSDLAKAPTDVWKLFHIIMRLTDHISEDFVEKEQETTEDNEQNNEQ